MRSLVFAAACAAALLVTAHAPADAPPPGGIATPVLASAPSVPTYSSPYSLPPGYPPPWIATPPPRRLERNDPVLMGGGIALVSLGTFSVIMGTALLAASSTSSIDAPNITCCQGCTCVQDLGDKNAGLETAAAIALVGGGISVAVGIPMLVVGARKVPASAPLRGFSFLPGPRGAMVRYTF